MVNDAQSLILVQIYSISTSISLCIRNNYFPAHIFTHEHYLAAHLWLFAADLTIHKHLLYSTRISIYQLYLTYIYW